MNANSIVSLSRSERRQWLLQHTIATKERLDGDWDFWVRDDQKPPKGRWNSWLFLGGRGAGKTRAGAEWLARKVQAGQRCALIGPSLHDVREVMIDGQSGLRTIALADQKPTYEVSRRRLRWPNGGVAYAFSAEDPKSLRGPQFHYAWADEFCAWRQPGETLAQVRMGLRLGSRPQLCVTTTPKPISALRVLMKEKGIVMTRASTLANKVGLSDVFLDGLRGLYGGTRLAAQELEGLVIDDDDRALWRVADLERCYGAKPPVLDSLVVAVDPPITAHGDACGIVVAGRLGDRGYVLEDATVSGLTPLNWATKVAVLVKTYGAHRITHAPNMGGRFSALDEELMALGSDDIAAGKSPDRADALVWALTALLIDGRAEPRLSRL